MDGQTPATANPELTLDSRSTTINVPSPLEKEILDDEARVEKYGGDDVREPPPKSLNGTSLPAVDPLLVTWDSPQDPENPQNWSYAYKWMLTILIGLITFEVCVLNFLRDTSLN
jgi:hypothetical protein